MFYLKIVLGGEDEGRADSTAQRMASPAPSAQLPSNLGGALPSLSVPLCSPCCTRHKAQAGRMDCCWSGSGICLASLYCLHSWKVAVKELWALLSLGTDGCRVGAGAQGRHLCGSPGFSLRGTRTLVLSRAWWAGGQPSLQLLEWGWLWLTNHNQVQQELRNSWASFTAEFWKQGGFTLNADHS